MPALLPRPELGEMEGAGGGRGAAGHGGDTGGTPRQDGVRGSDPLARGGEMARGRRTKESTIKQAQGATRLPETHKGVKNPDFAPKKFPGGGAELTATPRQAGSCPSLEIGGAEKPVGVPPPRGLGAAQCPGAAACLAGEGEEEEEEEGEEEAPLRAD